MLRAGGLFIFFKSFVPLYFFLHVFPVIFPLWGLIDRGLVRESFFESVNVPPKHP
jgi:hypothetical protein